MQRSALDLGALRPIWIGFSLLVVPLVARTTPSNALLARKLLSVMGGVVVAVVLGLSLLLLGVWLRRYIIGQRQRDNDRIAQEIMSALRADPGAPVGEFYLYLRAFETTGRLRIPLYLRLRKLSIGLFQLVTSDLESYVGNALRSVVPLIAMGRPGEAIGAGRIVAEERDWEADVVVLMRRARGILLVPSNRPGTLWEIDALQRTSLLSKVVFIMPPRTRGVLDTRERWEAARQVLASHAVEAPEHEERGLLFETGSDGRVSNVEPLLLNSARQVRRSLKGLLSDAPPKGGLYRSIAVAHQRARRARRWGWVETARQLSVLPLAAGALLLEYPDIGFDPAESWATVWDRSLTADAMSSYGLSELQGRLSRGVVRLDDANLRAYLTAYGAMLARVDQTTCAAIARGETEPAAMEIALTYIPFRRVQSFLAAHYAAESAEASGAPVAPLDPDAAGRETEEFVASLAPEGRQHYDRIAQAGGATSDEDRCWLARVAFGRVATLAEPHASLWARVLASTIVARSDSTPRGAVP